MAKTLCDWTKKSIEKRREELVRLVSAPQYVCAKCARVANSKRVLCRATKLPVAPPVAVRFRGQVSDSAA
jgi:hypothetical protein